MKKKNRIIRGIIGGVFICIVFYVFLIKDRDTLDISINNNTNEKISDIVITQKGSEKQKGIVLDEIMGNSKYSKKIELNKDIKEYEVNIKYKDQEECIVGYGELGGNYSSKINIVERDNNIILEGSFY